MKLYLCLYKLKLINTYLRFVDYIFKRFKNILVWSMKLKMLFNKKKNLKNLKNYNKIKVVNNVNKYFLS